MKHTVKCATRCAAVWLLTLFIITNLNVLVGAEDPKIEFIEKIEISQDAKSSLILPMDFCVTDDGLYLITDYQSGNIKVFEKKEKYLELATVIGRKGYGKNGFVKPSYCFYSKEEGKFGVMDFGIRKIFIYNRIGRIDFERVKDIYCLDKGYDIQLLGDSLLISGYKESQDNEYSLYYINIENNQETFLLPFYEKFGFKSFREYKINYQMDIYTKAIGRKSWFDIQGSEVYFVWEGDLRIIKLNMGSESWISFGQKTSHYIKPYVSNELREGYIEGKFKTLRSAWSKMSYVMDLFTSPKYVLLIYGQPVKQGNERVLNCWLQFYTLDGAFLREVPVSGQRGYYMMYFDKDKDVLYSLSNGEKEGQYFILKYKIQ